EDPRLPGAGDDRHRRGYGVDRQVARPEDGGETRAAAAEQLRLVPGAVVERRVREDDVPGPELVQPPQVGTPTERVVQQLVLREVVLAEPAAHDRDSRARQVDRLP